MNYEDFEYIREDKLTGQIFGPKNQIEILGVCGTSGKKKIHAVKCKICEKDPELFGDGLFKVYAPHLRRGTLPCACASKNFYSEREYEVLIKRSLSLRGFTFIGWATAYNSVDPKIIISCGNHSDKSVKLREVLKGKFGCIVCVNSSKKKSFEDKVQQLIDLKFYSEGTRFSIDSNPRNPEYNYWRVYCPDCDTEYSSIFNNLLRLKKGCSCVSDTRYAYILEISDEKGLVALKFGISCNPLERHNRIQLSSDFNLHTIGIYEFPDVNSCRTAEYACKRMLNTRVLSKQEMSDGYTETTGLENLENIKSIYYSHGGEEATSQFYSDVIDKALESTKQKIRKLIPKLDKNHVEIKNRLMYIVGMVKDDTETESV